MNRVWLLAVVLAAACGQAAAGKSPANADVQANADAASCGADTWNMDWSDDCSAGLLGCVDSEGRAHGSWRHGNLTCLHGTWQCICFGPDVVAAPDMMSAPDVPDITDVPDTAADVTIVLDTTDVTATDALADTAPAPNCPAAISALAAEAKGTGSCTTVLRIVEATKAISGFSITCGKYQATDEATARATAKADTGLSLACTTPASITGASPTDDFVFSVPATAAACACCGDGWLTAVNARTGLTVFGSGILFGPDEPVVFPKMWQVPWVLGPGCASKVAPPWFRGFDLTNVQVDQPPPQLDPATLKTVRDIVWQTALPDALAQGGYVFDAVVLRYDGHAMDPQSRVWIVLLNSGWLE